MEKNWTNSSENGRILTISDSQRRYRHEIFEKESKRFLENSSLTPQSDPTFLTFAVIGDGDHVYLPVQRKSPAHMGVGGVILGKIHASTDKILFQSTFFLMVPNIQVLDSVPYKWLEMPLWIHDRKFDL